MIVVIDTNALYGDLVLGGPLWRILAAQHRRGHFELVFPEVIVRELVKKFREQFVEASDRLKKEAQRLDRLGHPGVIEALPDLRLATEQYEARLRQTLADSKIDVTPMPDVRLSEFVDRSLSEKRPFQAKGRGFRDAVIWESVAEQAARSEVVLVSNNDSDFAHSKAEPERLHEHLVYDVAARGLHSVSLTESLKSLIDSKVPSSPDTEIVKTRLRQDEAFRRTLEELVRDELDRFVWDKDDTVTIVDSEYGDIENVELLVVDGLEYVAIADAHELDEESVLLDVVAAAWLTFSFTADQSLVEWLDEEGADIQIDIREETWAQGSTMSRPVAVQFSIDYALDPHDLRDIQRGSAEDAAVNDEGDIVLTAS